MSTACIVDDVVYIPDLLGFVHCLDARTGKPYWVYDVRACTWGSCYFADGKVFLGNEDGDVFIFRHDPKPPVLGDPPGAYGRAKVEALQNPRPGTDAKTREKEAQELARAAQKQANKKIEDRVLIRKVELDQTIRSTPSAAGETLYIAAENKLIAIAAKSPPAGRKP
jgi:hypothetical protein